MIRAVGVVVPAHNEQELLPGCLESLRRAARIVQGVPVHLVVVADACRDRTAEAARRGKAAVVTIGGRNVGAARAMGMREILCRTRHLDPAAVWLATTDADTRVPAGWLRQQLRYADRGWDAVVGTVRVTDWSGHRPGTRSLFRERYGDGTGPHSHVHGANLGFRAAAYMTAGGFPATATAEDHALVAAMEASGSPILRTRSVTVLTSARRRARAPHGFSHYLTELADQPDAAITA
ncbi:MAG TPA: glycosyltransferase [Trebonia sp.]|nr:glycosyltransferase [Trebonia sp.]